MPPSDLKPSLGTVPILSSPLLTPSRTMARNRWQYGRRFRNYDLLLPKTNLDRAAKIS
jgi:hypothetical protein